MADTNQPANYRPDASEAAIAALRNSINIRAFAAAEFTGARNGAVTGLAGITSGASQFDIFARAAAFASSVGQNPYNNWLDASAKPLFEFFPKAFGVYVGGMGDDATVDIAKIITETCIVTIQKQGQVVVARQPLLTAPAGIGIDSIGWDSSGLGPFWRTRNGQLGTQGLMPIQGGVVFDRQTALSAYLQTTPNGALALAAVAGNFPTEGAIIGIVVYGVAELGIGATR